MIEQTKLKVLITVPDLGLIGGKANYYSALNGRFTNEVKYFTYGPRANNSAQQSRFKLFRLFADYRSFFSELRGGGYQLVHVNPSLEPNGFLRDALFVFIAAKLLKIPTIVFWRGWSNSFEQKVQSRLMWLFKVTFKHASAMIVLADDFRKTLQKWGFKSEIHQETTVVDETLLEGLNETALSQKYELLETRLLFLSRIESNKGIFEILDTYIALKPSYPGIKLDFGGTGGALAELQQRVKLLDDPDVRVLGFVRGHEKRELLQGSHVFLFPSTHDEGLPNSVLEAMGCGMPIVTTWNAGIKDFFEDGQMGTVLQDVSDSSLKDALIKLFSDRQSQARMAKFNYRYSLARFTASHVVVRLEDIYQRVYRNSIGK